MGQPGSILRLEAMLLQGQSQFIPFFSQNLNLTMSLPIFWNLHVLYPTP